MRKKRENPDGAGRTRSGLNKRCFKDTVFSPQYQTVKRAFGTKTPKTMLMVSKETGVLRANICRYVRDMEKRGMIKKMYKGICKISKSSAGYYSTNIDLILKKEVADEGHKAKDNH